MKQFDVYSHPVHGFKVVKNGFSWPGFFFTWLWMMLRDMWVGAAILFGSYFAVWILSILIATIVTPDADGHLTNALDKAVENEFGELMNADELTAAELDAYNTHQGFFFLTFCLAILITNLIVGMKGNAWRRRVLARRGFKHLKSIQAQNADAAIAKVKAAEEATDETSP